MKIILASFILSINFLTAMELEQIDTTNTFDLEKLRPIGHDESFVDYDVESNKTIKTYKLIPAQIVAECVLTLINPVGALFFILEAERGKIYSLLKAARVYFLHAHHGYFSSNEKDIKKSKKYEKLLKTKHAYVSKRYYDNKLDFDTFINRINNYVLLNNDDHYFEFEKDLLRTLFKNEGKAYFNILMKLETKK